MKFNKYNFMTDVFVFIEKTPKEIILVFPTLTKTSLSFSLIKKTLKKIFLFILFPSLFCILIILINILLIISLYSLFPNSGSEKIKFPFVLNKNKYFFSKIKSFLALIFESKDSLIVILF